MIQFGTDLEAFRGLLRQFKGIATMTDGDTKRSLLHYVLLECGNDDNAPKFIKELLGAAGRQKSKMMLCDIEGRTPIDIAKTHRVRHLQHLLPKLFITPDDVK